MSNKQTEYSVQTLKNLSADMSVIPPVPREGVLGIDGSGNYRNLLCNASGEVIIDTTNLDARYILDAADTVKDTHIDWGTGASQVSADDIPDGATNAIITLTQETNFEAAYTHIGESGASHTYINQDVTTTASPTFANVYVPDGGFMGVSGADGWTFDSSNGDITTTSSVGIGIAAPLAKLHVTAAENAVGIYVTADATSTPATQFVIYGTTNIGDQLRLGYNTTANVASIQATYDDSPAMPGASLVLNPDGGNVGIGLSDPDEELELYNGTFKISANATDYVTFAADINGGLLLTTVDAAASLAHITCLPDGNFGIGTSPDNKLHVKGGTNVSVAQFARASDSCQIIIADNDTTGYFGVKDSAAFFGLTSELSANNLVMTSSNNLGLGVTDPDTKFEIYHVGTQLKLSGGAADYATFAVAADGALTITTVDTDAAEGDIILSPDGDVGLWETAPSGKLHLTHNMGAATLEPASMVLEVTGGGSGYQNRLAFWRDGDTGPTDYQRGGVFYAGSTIFGIADYEGRDMAFYTGSGASSVRRFQIGSAGISYFIAATAVAKQPAQLTLYDNTAQAAGVGGFINFGGIYNAGGSLTQWAAIGGIKENGTSGQYGGHMVFYTRAHGAVMTNTERMRIEADGDVGIGTTAPGANLHISGTTDNTDAFKVDNAAGTNIARFKADSSGHGILVLEDASNVNQVVLRANGLSYLNGGDVGINDTAPSYKLDVNGTGRFTGKLTLDSGSDPPYVMYDRQTRESIINMITNDVPPSKMGGAVMYFNEATNKMEILVPNTGKIFDFNGEEIASIKPIKSNRQWIKEYVFSEYTGKIIEGEVEDEDRQYKFKDGCYLDKRSGKFYKKEIDEEKNLVFEEEVERWEAVEKLPTATIDDVPENHEVL